MADLFRKTKSLYSSTANSFGTGTGETITPASVAGLPTDTEITLTFDRLVAGKIERIIGTISGGNFVVRTSPSTGRGADGTSDQAHTSPTVEYIPNAKDTNDMVDGILVDHKQDGTHEDMTSYVSAASTSAAGKVELANASEVTTGTSTTLAVTPDSLAGSDYGKRVVGILAVAPDTDTAIGDGKAFFRIPSVMNGWNLVGVAMSVFTAGTTNTTDVQIRNVTDSVDMLSTKLTIDSTEVDTSTAATAAVIDATKDDVATGDRIAIDIDAVSTTAAKGLYCELVFQLP
jgi:hypothetical protein